MQQPIASYWIVPTAHNTGCLFAKSGGNGVAGVAQGHALFTRAAGSQIPCPQIDFENGWNEYMAAVYQLPSNETIKSKFGAAFGAQPDRKCSVSEEGAGVHAPSGLLKFS